MAGARRLGGLVDGLWGALLPVQCAGCLAWDEVLCPSCRSLAVAPALPTAVDGARGPIPGVVLGDYSGPLRRIVLTAKHAARTDVSDFLDEAGAALGTSLREVVAPVGSPPGRVGGVTGRVCAAGEAVTVWVVPAPSSWRRRLRHDEGAGTTHTVTASPAAHTLPVTPPTLPGGDPTGATTSRRDVPRAAPASSRKSDTSVRAACLAVRTMRRKGPE